MLSYKEDIVKKFFLALIVVLPSISFANTNALTQDLVGSWHCVADDGSYLKKALIHYYANGSATELVEIIAGADYLPERELIVFDYQWKAKDNKLFMNNLSIAYYQDYFISADGSFHKIDSEATEGKKAFLTEHYQKDNWHYIEFDGKNKHRYYFEDGYEGHCQRLS